MLNPAQVEQFLARLPVRHREKGVNVPFLLNPNQKILNKRAQELYDQGKPLWMIILKSRRVGGSAWTDAYLTCHCLAKEQAEALIVAHQYKSSTALFSIPKGLTAGLPFKVDNSQQHRIVFPHKGGASTLSIATAGSMTGGRGLTLSALHVSEAAFVPGIGSFTSLIPAVSYDPSTILVLESTANGKVGPGESFYQYWMSAVEGRNEFMPVFLGWLDDPGCYRHPDEAKDAPIDEEEKDLIRFIRARKDHTEAQIKGRLAWRRWALETRCQGMVELFEQEFPHTPEIAFVSTGEPAFEKSELAFARASIKKHLAKGGFKRLGTDPIWEEGAGEWLIWKHPEPRHFYYIGADAARGEELGESGQMRGVGDFAAAIVFDGTTGEMVARLCQKISPEKLADELDRVGRYYNKAMIAVELTGNLGLWAQVRLRDTYMYPNLYHWRGKDDKVRKPGASQSLGWETTMRTRDLMFSAFRTGLREERLMVRDSALLTQMEAATRKEGLKWEVVKGHDDLLMAAMIGWVACEQWAPPRSLGSSKPKEAEEEQLPLAFQSDHIYALKRHWERVTKYNKHSREISPDDRLRGI